MRHWIRLPLPLDVLFEDFLDESADEPLLLVSVVEAWSQMESVRNNQLGQTVAAEADAEPSPGGVTAPLTVEEQQALAIAGSRRVRQRGCAPLPGHRAAWGEADRQGHERADPLQRRLAGFCGCRQRDGPAYAAQAQGKAFHVYCDETRSRSQGATLTAWEAGAAGISHQVIADNAAGHLMQRGKLT